MKLKKSQNNLFRGRKWRMKLKKISTGRNSTNSVQFTENFSMKVNAILGFIFIFMIINVESLPTLLGNTRILNGTDADLNEFPWMALITEETGIGICGGSLITNRHVLTAAHCVLGVDEKSMQKIRVRLGEHDRSTDTETQHLIFKVINVNNHPLYTPMFLQDFAILELETEVPMSREIHPICLVPQNVDLVGQNALVAGWGLTQNGGLPSAILQKATVPIVSNQDCQNTYHKNGHPSLEITDSMLCAGGLGPDSCQRDSGGPLMWQDDSQRFHLVGVVSWGEDCGTMFPGVYGRITYAEEWIQYVTNIKLTCPFTQ